MTAAQAPAARGDAPPDAVVVGLCAHGLAVARSLAARGLSVLALEPDASNPGVRTRLARVESRGPINGPGLATTLLSLAEESGWSRLPVLFLTNDNMVRNVAENCGVLRARYRWSWQDCASELLFPFRRW